ncbi:hypothetical protein N7G274_002307 [Stereocaulon virgatum]|uniref:Rhodopsin domain-containing protein n=1 Tax=Stereocaulon virgatum TaxID=373712 RepID=A0ABR4AHI4_9LECA
MSIQLSPTPNGDQSRTGIILAMTIAALMISCIFVALRMYTRLFVTKCAWWDDLTSCLTLLGIIIGAGLDITRTHYGFGRHQYYLSNHQFQEFEKYSFGNWIQTFSTLMFTKVSICLLLLRFAPSKRVIRPIQGLIAFLVASNVIFTMFWILQCTPPSAAWNVANGEKAQCFTLSQIERIIIIQAAISLVSDLLLAASPILFIRSTTCAFRENSPLYCLMGLGLLTFVCCLVRTVLSRQFDQPDQTWVSVDNFLWRTAETTLGLVAACLPTLRPLWSLIHHRIIAKRKHRTETVEKEFIFNRLRRGQRNMSTIFPTTSQKQLPALPPPNPRFVSNEQTGYYGHRDSDSETQGASYFGESEAGYSRAMSSEAGYSQVVNEHVELARRVMDFQPVVQRREERDVERGEERVKERGQERESQRPRSYGAIFLDSSEEWDTDAEVEKERERERRMQRERERPRLDVNLDGDGGLGTGRSDWGQEVWEGISRLEIEPLRVAFRDV